MRVIEDLQLNGLKIIVDKESFSYGHDAVLLANFAHPSASESVLDIGTGTGILAILINGKTNARVTAVDIQADAARMAAESVEMNGQGESITVCHGDIRTLHERMPRESFDSAVCNPPYYTGGTQSENEAVSLSTYQRECNMRDVAACARRMLKNGGRLWLCYPASRLAEACAALVSAGVEPKRIQPVCGRAKAPYLTLIEAKKGGKTGLVWEQPIFNQE